VTGSTNGRAGSASIGPASSGFGLPVVPGSLLGVVANPMSGRDIRRLVAQASVFPNAEKTNMVLRLVAAAGATGVERVLVSTDAMGVAAGVLRALDKRRRVAGRWPELEFVELGTITGTADDTRATVRAMRERGAAPIVLLGGDGTVRAAADASGDAALLPLSTGTNNAFPEMWEATIAGTAAGLLATGRVDAADVTRRAKVLRVDAGTVHETALVDVCVSTVTHVGSKALWQPATLRELYCAFAEPHAIGLSSVAGLLHPASRSSPEGVRLRLGAGGSTVFAPIAPGVVTAVEVADAGPLRPGEPHRVALDRGTVAVDGEREIEFGPSNPVQVTLAHDGPRVLDVRAVLASAATRRLLVAPDSDTEISIPLEVR
jgi:predicted polyphosphate/ATP-dependent NAD kinase